MSDLWKLSAAETARMVRAREISAREATESALARLDAVNPAINAVVDPLHDEARAAADAVDAALARGEDAGPLAGVPVTIKTNVDQKGRATSNGLRLQRDLIATEDNPVTANMRKAGAVIIGRTNVPAFSIRWFSRNSLHGATKNPHDPGLTPGGSSGGAAAAVAAGIGAVGHGTDIAGSIRYPAYACGVHGLRPSYGRVPAWNPSGADRHIGAQLMAVSGPIARTVEDLRLSLAAMAAPDARDPLHVPAPLVGPEAPRRAALAIRPEGMAVAPEVEAAVRDAAARLEAQGWTVEPVETPPLREALALQLTLWLAEFRRTGAKAVAAEGDPDAQTVYARLAARAPEVDRDGLLDVLQRRLGLMRAWRVFFETWPVLLCPVSGMLPFADQSDVGPEADFDAIIEAQLLQIALPFCGLPGLSVATGMAGTAPVGVQLIASHYREDLLLDAGAAIAAGGTSPSPVDPRE
ncbi:MAG: amidase [Rhodobacteraceae bacterium]|nr:MAG: amidase [Paracoccaceae bacterium]